MAECEHKFKVLKEIKKEGKNMFGLKTEDLIYHLQCEKCGDIVSRKTQA